jgi:hypothetical protein
MRLVVRETSTAYHESIIYIVWSGADICGILRMSGERGDDDVGA